MSASDRDPVDRRDDLAQESTTTAPSAVPEPGAAVGSRVEDTPGEAGDIAEPSYPEGATERDPEATWLGDQMQDRRQEGDDARQDGTAHEREEPEESERSLHDMGGDIGPASIRGSSAPVDGGHGPEVVWRHEEQEQPERPVPTSPAEEPDRDRGTSYERDATQPVVGPDEFHTATDADAEGS